MGLISDGTTIFDAGAMSVGGSIKFIKKLTASSSATLSFVDGSASVVLDSTYKEYIFKCTSIHPETNAQAFSVNFTIDGTNWNVTKTTTVFRSQHDEADTDAGIQYQSSKDIAQGTGNQELSTEIGNDNDQSCSGYLRLFNPSSTTFVKHFLATFNGYMDPDYSNQDFLAGYCNTTSAVTGVRFLFASGDIDAGTIKLYGVT